MFSAAYNDGRESKKDQREIKNEGPIPKLGTIILFNEILRWQDRNMPRPHRGCGLVSAETDYLIFIDCAIYPGHFIKTSFPKSDFRLGLIQFVTLKDFVYKKETTYVDLDIKNLSGYIKKLVVDM